MKNKLKKVVSVILAVSLIFGTSTLAFAQGEAFCLEIKAEALAAFVEIADREDKGNCLPDNGGKGGTRNAH